VPAYWRGGTLALVADLHLGNGRGTRFARRAVAKLQQLQSDAVLISGDLFDGSKADLDATLKTWKGLSAPTGVYFVTGNHE
jgi:predicted MPP superfamily phosphohydrolase